MGAYLDVPIKDKNPEPGKNHEFAWGACSMQGWRCSQEDSHICEEYELNGKYVGMCFGVFDGHGGKEVAQYAKEHFKRIFIGQEAFKKGEYKNAL